MAARWELYYHECDHEFNIISDVKKVLYDGSLIDWVKDNPYKRLIPTGERKNYEEKKSLRTV